MTPPTQLNDSSPSFKAINARHKILKQNASSVLVTLGGGNQGLLALAFSNNIYQQLTGAVWIEPLNLGQRPIIPAGSTRVAQKNITSQYQNDAEAWKLVQDVREALKKKMLDAVEDEYSEDLKDPDTGYATITPLQLIDVLHG